MLKMMQETIELYLRNHLVGLKWLMSLGECQNDWEYLSLDLLPELWIIEGFVKN
jgi:hypothetical protein